MAVGIYKDYIEDFPVELQNDPDFQALGAILDELDRDALDAIKSFKTFFDVEKIPVFLLNYIGYEIGAQITTKDTAREKRQKIRDAVEWHKIKGTPGMASYWIERVTGVTPLFTGSDGYANLAIWESLNDLQPFPNDYMKWESLNGIISGGFGWGSILTSGTVDRFIVFIDTQVENMTDIMLDRVEEVIKYFGAGYIQYNIGYRSPGWNLYRQVY